MPSREDEVWGLNAQDHDELQLIINRSGETDFVEGRVRNLGGSGGTRIAVATGGIAARAGTTPGSATCTQYKIESGVLVTNTETFTVYNLSLLAIPADAFVIAHKEMITGQWVTMAIINGLRYSSPNLQYTIDGTTWVTWHTATTTCPP